MKRFFRRSWIQLVRDDLFIRVAWLIAGTMVGGFGAFIVVGLLREAPLSGLTILGLLIGALFILWGALLISRCMTSSGSRIAALAEKSFPDGVEPAVIVVYLAIFLPTVIVTYGLRWFGIKGERIRRRPSPDSPSDGPR